ncbi:beta-N-acetylhexosaminidase [Streptomyces sp. NPDC090053]|uniref:beta-N-acetylhexosaminidase n=1 Tax=Streptomyces sp. NPDC090053 TaxID=3365932 RepID=UPI0038235D29
MNVSGRLPGRPLSRRTKTSVIAVAMVVTVGVSTAAAWGSTSSTPAASGAVPLTRVVPQPASVQTKPGVAYTLSPGAAIQATAGSADAKDAADFLAGLLRKPTGYALPVRSVPSSTTPTGVALVLGGADSLKGAEGYQLDVTSKAVTIRANKREGLFNGIETLRQLLPAKLESPKPVGGPWRIQGGTIKDQPRYGFRGAMLDVARNFMPDTGVKRYIDDLARYKINYLHLHLVDDQGWRIQIDSWPNLTKIGGSTGVGGISKGYYTKAQYKDIVGYAWSRGVTVIPEIEGSDHQQAALASYAELNCDGKARELYTGFLKSDEGLLCVDKPITYTFMDQVIKEVAEMTPGPYIGIGGDETQNRSAAELKTYYNKVGPLVQKYGKKVYGWQESAVGLDPATTTTELWGVGIGDDEVIAAAKGGAKVVMAPSDHAYIDMKYNAEKPEYPVGNTWAGTTDVPDSYNWDPKTVLKGLPESAIAGVEAPLWTETVFGMDQLENLAFPRLLSIAEIGWSPESSHNWDSFKTRLAAQGPRLREARVNYYIAPEIPWPSGS